MSDPKRASLITVGAPKSAKNNVNKTLRLSINLYESNESKYPELNYKKLVIAETRKNNAENCKKGLDPFCDNDDNDEIEKVARKFEQKYGGKSTYGKKGRSRHDDFTDIGAGYDVNDPFIDNTHGYDEIVPPECDTTYGGFYINSGVLEFKTVPLKSDNNKRRISSSSSEEESSQSSSDSDSQDAKDPKAITNGTVDSHKTEHRKKKNKNIDKQKAKKIRRTDSSAATSGKQTSDENVQGDGESADSRTSQSDSLTSKPAPSSETAATSDSSRDAEAKVEIKLPATVSQILEELETLSRFKENLGKDDGKTDACFVSLERALSSEAADDNVVQHAWARAAKLLAVPRDQLRKRAAERSGHTAPVVQNSLPVAAANTGTKRKVDQIENMDCSRLTPKEREAKIEEILQRLTALIKDREPGMMATYNAECERVEEERRRRSGAAPAGAERRRPKRRFPWCARARALLTRLAALGGAPAHPHAAAALLAERALPLFPDGFVRMPTLLKQADLNKDIKASDLKRQRVGSMTQTQAQPAASAAQFTEPIQFPSSLTVTTSVKTLDKTEEDKYKGSSAPPALITSFTLNKDLVIEKPEDRKAARSKEDYIPSNSIGSITITPVPNKDKKIGDKAKEPLLRVKSPAALNEMVHKKDKPKKPEKIASAVREKRVESPLHIETSFPNKKDTPSPKSKEEISLKVIETMRSVENDIPRPARIAVHHSPTFAKPDKRPPEVKKKKEVMIMSDLDPLSDAQEPLAVDDSSSDVEVVEEKDKSEPSEVPLNQDNVSVKSDTKCQEVFDETTEVVMRNLRAMAQQTQEQTKPNCTAYGGVITSAGKMSSKQTGREESRDKLTSFFEENGWD